MMELIRYDNKYMTRKQFYDYLSYTSGIPHEEITQVSRGIFNSVLRVQNNRMPLKRRVVRMFKSVINKLRNIQ